MGVQITRPFQIKCILAKFFDLFGINRLWLRRLNRKYHNQYIRMVNYHFSPKKDAAAFEAQVQWLLTAFEPCDRAKLDTFLAGDYQFSSKPGIIFTFDDGFLENYEVAHPILQKYGVTGWYMISSGLVGKRGYVCDYGWPMDYIDAEQLRALDAQGDVIACHTHSHHRMNETDTPEILKAEITDAKAELEELLGHAVDIFCWCGGEEETYTKAAADVIRASGFRYGFMTCSSPVTRDSDLYQLDRANLEPNWPLSLLRFQVCGPMDRWFQAKRERVRAKTKEEKLS